MFTGNQRLVPPLVVLFVALALAACGGGSSGGPAPLVAQSVTQDLDLDPEGRTTVVAFAQAAPLVSTANVEADNGAQAQSVAVDGSELTIVWDDRVTPSDRVRFLGVSGLSSAYLAVGTSDASAPSFTVGAAVQVTGLGGDLLTIPFSGPHVVPALVTDGSNWEVTIDGETFSLANSTLAFDVPTQTLTVTTDPGVNLHASFQLAAEGLTSVADVPLAATPVSGAAAGDVTAPTLVAVEQVLSADEYGRVVDFTFSEAMDPAFCLDLANFTIPGPIFPLSVTQPAAERLRVTFDEPIVPGVDSVSVFDLVDAHGNPHPDGAQPVVAGSTVANAYANPPEVRTVEGVGGDVVVVETVQALDPESAETAANWTLTIDGNPVDLSAQTLSYDLLARTLTITLAVDTTNGLAFDLTPVGPLDVDGEPFAVPASGTVDGDVVAPLVTQVLQNRELDEEGDVLDVTFSEDVEETSAELVGNWSVAGGPSVLSATRLADERVVRLRLDGPAVPGDVTLGLGGVTDPAGNAVQPLVGLAVVSDDETAPQLTAATATGNEGLDDDTLAVVFDDLMVEADVTDPTRWAVQSPIGTPLDTTGASVTWNAATRTATLTFDAGNGVDFQVDDDFRVELIGARDLGGNAIGGPAQTGTAVVELNLPALEAAYVRGGPNDDQVVVVFDEPLAVPDVFVQAELFDDQGQSLGAPLQIARVVGRPRELELTFSQSVLPGSDVLQLRGVTDAAGNPAFSVDGLALDPADPTELTLDGGSSAVTALMGENNDTLEFVFDRAPSSFELLDRDHYVLRDGGVAQNLSAATLSYDGDRTVTLTLLGGFPAQSGSNYTLEVDGLWSVQGVPMSGADSVVVAAGGDLTAPDVTAGRVTLDPQTADAVLVEFSEAIDADDLVDPNSYTIGVTHPDTVVALGPRTARLVFSGGVIAGDTLDVTAADLAGNLGVVSRLVSAADAVGPGLSSAEAVAVPGTGGDHFRLGFDEPLSFGSATNPDNFALSVNGTAVDLSGVVIEYRSVGNELRIPLPAGLEFDVNGTADVQVSGVRDMSGNAMAAPANVAATLTGDAQAPGLESACVDYRASGLGTALLVRFDEAIDPAVLLAPGTYSTSGGAIGVVVEGIDDRTVRVGLSNQPGAAETLQVTGVPDLAGNAGGALSIDPVE